MIIVALIYFLKFPLELMYDFDVYPVIGFILGVYVIRLVSLRRQPKQLYLYTVVFFCFSLTGYLASGYLADNYFNMFYILFLQPIAIFSWFSSETDPKEGAIFLLKYLSFLALPLFLGATWFYGVYFFGLPDPHGVFALEFTKTAGSVSVRNTAFFGSSLIFCGVALVCFLSSGYLHYELKKRSFVVLEMISFLCVFMSLSRRAILPILVFYCFLFFCRSSNLQRLRMSSIGALAIVILFVLQPGMFSLAVDRIWSIFDVTTDKGNVSRIILMLEGLKHIIFHPFGSGLGTQSAIGFSVEEVKAAGSITVTESTIITLIGEVGFIWVIVLLTILGNLGRPLFRNGYFVYTVPVFVESIIGLGFLSPIVSFVTLIFLFSLFRINRAHES